MQGESQQERRSASAAHGSSASCWQRLLWHLPYGFVCIYIKSALNITECSRKKRDQQAPIVLAAFDQHAAAAVVPLQLTGASGTARQAAPSQCSGGSPHLGQPNTPSAALPPRTQSHLQPGHPPALPPAALPPAAPLLPPWTTALLLPHAAAAPAIVSAAAPAAAPAAAQGPAAAACRCSYGTSSAPWRTYSKASSIQRHEGNLCKRKRCICTSAAILFTCHLPHCFPPSCHQAPRPLLTPASSSAARGSRRTAAA